VTMYEEKIIDGKALAVKIEEQVKSDVAAFKARTGVTPMLATILVGEHPPSKLYVKLKHWACRRVGIKGEDHKFPEETSLETILSLLGELAARKDIHGILVQLPLPKHLDERTVMSAIDPAKDVDGFHPLNMGRMLIGKERFVPCTPRGVILALEDMGVEVKGKNVVIVGHSNVVGKPMAAMLINRNATVEVCHVFTEDLRQHTSQADILIVATGVRGLIKADMVRQGAIVFDVGITWLNDTVYGDVDFDSVAPVASRLSPVPGGVGPITIAVLMQHTLLAAGMQVTNDTG